MHLTYLYVLGGIDTATNFKNDEEAADDFHSGTRAALAGGTTTVVDLVVPGKEESLLEAVASWKEDIEASACCDVALTVAITRWDDTTKGQLISKGNFGFFISPKK